MEYKYIIRVDSEINISIWICCMKKKSLIEDERKDEAKRPPRSLEPNSTAELVVDLLWHKIVAVQCNVWSL